MPLSATKNLVCRLRMLPVAWARLIVAPEAFERFMVNDLVGPPVAKVVMGTLTVSEVTPAGKTRVPEVCV